MERRRLARAQLHRSVDRLGVDSLDLYQPHAMRRLDELDACTSPGGALEGLAGARDEGLVRFLGITGHTHHGPVTFVQAPRRFSFEHPEVVYSRQCEMFAILLT